MCHSALMYLAEDSLAPLAGFLAPASHSWMKFGAAMMPQPPFVISNGTIYLCGLWSKEHQTSTLSAIHGPLDLALAVRISTKTQSTSWRRRELPHSLWPLINTSLRSKFAPSVLNPTWPPLTPLLSLRFPPNPIPPPQPLQHTHTDTHTQAPACPFVCKCVCQLTQSKERPVTKPMTGSHTVTQQFFFERLDHLPVGSIYLYLLFLFFSLLGIEQTGKDGDVSSELHYTWGKTVLMVRICLFHTCFSKSSQKLIKYNHTTEEAARSSLCTPSLALDRCIHVAKFGMGGAPAEHGSVACFKNSSLLVVMLREKRKQKSR